MIKVKICGITKLEDALACVDNDADAVGFVFAESPRKINKFLCKEIISQLPPFITTVGLFADQSQNEIGEIVDFCGLDVLQFHGAENSGFCKYFSRRIIKSFRMKNASDLVLLKDYNVSAYLLDAYNDKKLGGTGEKFDWEGVSKDKSLMEGKKIILAGGLNSENVSEAIKIFSPYGVDVSSGVEKAPGVKDFKKIKKFINVVRNVGAAPCSCPDLNYEM